ncbi:MAG: 16S rRNA (cytidine(1402)-2'-O)-methyltransferase [Hydrogenophilaceae bacterium]|nr:16S rRNA (cytidine(1402)-2'-O)-methyltransferase [Hydrogenophilaceae bacterium]
MNENRMTRGLYVVATPIGNLGDITLRALEVLRQVDRVAAEDTRVTGRMLSGLGISKPMLSIREHNERKGADKIIERIRSGEAVAYVSDAGTPAISDPGSRLVEAVRMAGLGVVSIPGASAATAALSVSGLSQGAWYFAGFLPPRQKARREVIASLKNLGASLVFYEAPHRIRETLADLQCMLGSERRIFIARELTKQFEEAALMRLSETEAWLNGNPYREKGEFVLVVEGATEERSGLAEAETILRTLAGELPASQAARLAAKITGRKKSDLYALLVNEHD